MRFFMLSLSIVIISCILSFAGKIPERSWIRINLMGYQPDNTKVAIWCSADNITIKNFQLIEATTKKVVLNGVAGKEFGAYGPFRQTYRLNFSMFKKEGSYFLQAGIARSPVFRIGKEVYKRSADFCLRYMRQQRSGFNPFLKDSCHTHDGYLVYGPGTQQVQIREIGATPIPDSFHVDVVGGWHDASDYLQYSSTSANATFHLLLAYRDFPDVFSDEKQANGLEGSNAIPDILDEAKWGLDWLLKMHPRNDWMFNQIADDRDHISMRIPGLDSQYNKGYERPVYFITGEPQGLFQYKNRTTGTSSTAGKFASAFALGSEVFKKFPGNYPSELLFEKASTSLDFAMFQPGVTQTAPGRAPYFYEEDNWKDDMELACAEVYSVLIHIGMPEGLINELLDSSYSYAKDEPVTPWLGRDTAKHYQWYPFINLGHYELARQLSGKKKNMILDFYKEGINRVWKKSKMNAFYRGVPFIWCSNNLTTSFAIQCLWYRQLTNDKQFEELEQANFDWLFGCNPWGTSMVYGLPANGDTPTDPHSAFTHLKNYPIDGGLVDGPVYGSIFNNLKGITLYHDDAYALFQSSLAVYHDDYGDYSTNEPTMDGTASLIYLLAAKESGAMPFKKNFTLNHGAIIRGDSTKNKLALVFTGDEYGEGASNIYKTLHQHHIKASFFLTGRFYNNPSYKSVIRQLKNDGHYLGAHSNDHLLYCDWSKRDSLLITKDQFTADLEKNFSHMAGRGIGKKEAYFFLPPFEWYNDTIAAWTSGAGLQLISFTPGTLSHADYTTQEDKNYRSSTEIYRSILQYEHSHPSGLNGFILLMHAGAGPHRKDKFYHTLPDLIKWLQKKGYRLVRVDDLLK